MDSRYGTAPGECTFIPKKMLRRVADPQSRAAIVKDKPFLVIMLSVVLLLAGALWHFHSLMWG